MAKQYGSAKFDHPVQKMHTKLRALRVKLHAMKSRLGAHAEHKEEDQPGREGNRNAGRKPFMKKGTSGMSKMHAAPDPSSRKTVRKQKFTRGNSGMDRQHHKGKMGDRS